ncbi:transcriptional regulator [Methylocystis bryophila]|uniref:Transcriptional regulator n=2 Tax=Methylocystis bryophila TaxID=655015 RepID=A0A1W6N0R5_9HYPH|nr:transcriptional regulator [Methylocystis bryophila]BDV40552.1 transcriptional regulator [Methylocystis bryophila]
MNFSELAPRAAEAEQFLKALGNRHRLMILCELHNGEAGVSELQRALGLSQSSLSQHLARLRRDKLVKTRRESQAIYYSLATADVTRFIALLADLFCAGDAERVKVAKLKRRGEAKASCSLAPVASRGQRT